MCQWFLSMLRNCWALPNIKSEIVSRAISDIPMIHRKFIIIEGIDGCGKGTVINAIIDFLKQNKIRFLDLRRTGADLRKKDLSGYNAIITCEPTDHKIGKEIRNIILKSIHKYDSKKIAERFAADRKVLYDRILVPALKKGLFVFQDRSFISSFVYQINQAKKNHEKLTEKDIARKNKIALENLPGLVIVSKINPKTAESRLLCRKDKVDDTEFEVLDFLKQNSESYKQGAWRDLVKSKGTEIEDFDSEAGIEEVKNKALTIIAHYCKKNNLDLLNYGI